MPSARLTAGITTGGLLATRTRSTRRTRGATGTRCTRCTRSTSLTTRTRRTRSTSRTSRTGLTGRTSRAGGGRRRRSRGHHDGRSIGRGHHDGRVAGGFRLRLRRASRNCDDSHRNEQHQYCDTQRPIHLHHPFTAAFCTSWHAHVRVPANGGSLSVTGPALRSAERSRGASVSLGRARTCWGWRCRAWLPLGSVAPRCHATAAGRPAGFRARLWLASPPGPTSGSARRASQPRRRSQPRLWPSHR